MSKVHRWAIVFSILAWGYAYSIPTHLIPAKGAVAWSFPGNLTIYPHSVTYRNAKIVLLNEQKPGIAFSHQLPATFNFLKSKYTIRNVKGFRQVVFHEVYPGIERVIAGLENGGISISWKVAPGADPSRIQFRIYSDDIQWMQNSIKVGTWEMGNLHAYQGVKEIEISLLKIDENTFTFKLGQYDSSKPIVIDPDLTTLESGTYLGGSNGDGITDIITSGDSVFVVGYTQSADFPVTPHAYDTSFNSGGYDVFVASFDKDLSTLYAATFLGGSDSDRGNAIAKTSDGGFVVAGQTFSSDFPIVYGYQSSRRGSADAFVAILNGHLSALNFSTYIGGDDVDWANDVVVGTGDTIFICGATYSNNYPLTTMALDNTYNGGPAGFITAFMPDLSTLVASTYISGDYSDELYKLAVDESTVVAVGYSSSPNIPMDPNGFDIRVDGQDAYIIRTDHLLQSMIGATFYGEQGPVYHGYPTTAYSVALTPSDKIITGGYINGIPGANILPIVGGFDNTVGGYSEGFVAIFDGTLQNLIASTYIGGDGDDEVKDVAWTTTTSQTILVVGNTTSNDMPYDATQLSPYDDSHNGGQDLFIYTLPENLNLTYGFTYYGGSMDDYAKAIVHINNSLIVAGNTDSSVIPLAGSPYDNSPDGPTDGFLAKFDNTGPPATGVSEHESKKSIYWEMPDRLVLNLNRASYIGIEMYNPAGRLVYEETFGVLPAGKNEIPVKVKLIGFIRVRVGDRVMTVKAMDLRN